MQAHTCCRKINHLGVRFSWSSFRPCFSNNASASAQQKKTASSLRPHTAMSNSRYLHHMCMKVGFEIWLFFCKRCFIHDMLSVHRPTLRQRPLFGWSRHEAQVAGTSKDLRTENIKTKSMVKDHKDGWMNLGVMFPDGCCRMDKRELAQCFLQAPPCRRQMCMHAVLDHQHYLSNECSAHSPRSVQSLSLE